MSVPLAWKEIYPWIKEAVSRLDSVDALLQETVEKLSTTYDADCILLAGLEAVEPSGLVCYATMGAWKQLAASTPASVDPPSFDILSHSENPVGQFCPVQLPAWVHEQQEMPRLLHTDAGVLIVPVLSRGASPEVYPAMHRTPLQLLLWLQRSPQTETPPPGVDTSVSPQWPLEDVESIQMVCSLLGLAYSALYWRQRLEQSRRQAALVGRISRLLNSSLNPDEVVGRIAAELGQGLNCDRCILVNLHHDPGLILATWDHPDQRLKPFEHREIDPTLWQDVMDMFLQGGASYLQVEQAEVEPDALQLWLAQIGAASVLVIPLFIQSEFFGVVALLSYPQKRLYHLDELQTARQVADQAAIALTNAQNYQSLWHRQETLRQQNSSLQREVVRDELTQLMNRRSLERELEQISMSAVWSVREVFSVVICDIDYFKLVNDSHGHLVGDEVLQELANRLQKQLRKDTPVYRYGGEEFITILMGADLNQAVDVAERLRYVIQSDPVLTSIGALRITASFGVTQRRLAQDHTAWDVVQRADQALYEAKRQGRDRVKAT